MSFKQEYSQFLRDNFQGPRIRQPLFYNWDVSLRFNLQLEKPGSDAYFSEVLLRANTLYEASFNDQDTAFFILLDYKYRRRKIRFLNYCFQQIKELKKYEVEYSKINNVYEPTGKIAETWNRAVIKTTSNRINYKKIFTAIANMDFPPRKPRLKFLSCEEIYFINVDKKLIFHMYDDRGLDLIAADVETLRPIYDKFNHWILDNDREKIDNMMVNIYH